MKITARLEEPSLRNWSIFGQSTGVQTVTGRPPGHERGTKTSVGTGEGQRVIVRRGLARPALMRQGRRNDQ